MKGRPVVKAVFPAEVEQRKAVAEYQQIPLFLPAHLAKIRIQVGKLLQIRRQVGLKIRCVGGVGGAQGVADGPAQLLGLHRGGPDMLVILYVVTVVVVTVVVVTVVVVSVVVIVAVTVHRLLLQSLGVVHHPQHRGNVFSGGA